MKVLVVGSNGKEHAIVWKLAQSNKVSQIFCAPGNPGTRKLAQNVDIRIDDISGLCEFAKSNNIDLTIVGSEISLSMGIVDAFKKNNLLVFGPTQNAARVQNNKSYAKRLLHRLKIPTAPFGIFDKEAQAIEYARKSKFPLIVKYDGVMTGKDVFLCETFDQAKKMIERGFENLFKAIVIEEVISGKKVSIPVVTDGYNAVPLSPVQVYRRALEGNGGLNTEGIGAYAPVSFVNYKMETDIASKVVFPLLDGLNKEGSLFTGILNLELIITDKGEPYVIEIKSMIGDPEAQSILPILETDFFEICYSTVIDALGDDYENFEFNNLNTASVVLTAGGYPGSFKKGQVIEGLDSIDDDDILVFHSGTTINKYGELVTSGGRVLTITSTASTLHRAYERVYEAIDFVSFTDMRYRKDIAKFSPDERKFFVNNG